MHVPKTAGCSIEAALHGRPISSDLLHNKKGYRINYQHAFPDEIPEFGKYFTFSFIRDPYDRIVSHYFHYKRLGLFTKKIGLEDFVRLACLSPHTLPLPATHNAVGFLSPAYNWANNVDYVGRFENLEEDWYSLLKILGLSKIRLPHINASDRKEVELSSYGKSLVASAYRTDFEAYGYS